MEKNIGFKTKKGKKRKHHDVPSSPDPAGKKLKTDPSEPEFSHIRFKFLLRSPETVATGLETFLNHSCEATDDVSDDSHRLRLLHSYLKSSPQCSEVFDLLTAKTTPKEVSLVFAWLRHVLQECPRVVDDYADIQQHIVKTLLAHHSAVLMASLRRGTKQGPLKSTLMLLLTVAGLGHRFATLLLLHLDLNHSNWPWLLTLRNRKDETDVRACMTAFLLKLLQVEDEDLARSLVDQRVLLQEILLGLKYDQSDYVAAVLRTIHTHVVLNKNLGKNLKIYLFNSPVLKELLALYHWPGPEQWKRQPTQEEKEEYTETQRELAGLVHAMLVDLLCDHKMGVSFRDKTLGLSKENKNSTVFKVLQQLVTTYSRPLSPRLVLDILRACPDQMQAYLKLLQPHLSPRPVDTWLVCLHFFLQIVQNHEWPSQTLEETDTSGSEDRASQLLRFLFPPETIIHSLKDGLKHACATIRHCCLHALEVIAVRGRHFGDMSRQKTGDQSPLTLSIEGFVQKTLPNGQVLLNLVEKLSSKDNFTTPITRDLYTDTQVPLPHVSRFQHLAGILRMYGLAPEHLAGGPVTALPHLLHLVATVTTSGEELDRPPPSTPAHLPALYLLQALSETDGRKLNLFGKGGSKGDVTQSLVYRMLVLMQAQEGDSYRQAALDCITKLVTSSGLFEGYTAELEVWLRHLQSAASAPEVVVEFVVGVLRQYMTNPYPAIDQLMEWVEGVTQGAGETVSYASLEFSPLVMFALTGEFKKHKKVHSYLCKVLIDIFHSTSNPGTFAQLVHSLSTDLDPEVMLYLSTSRPGEVATSPGGKMSKKSPRLALLESSKHPGLSLMLRFVKEGEVTKELVEDLAASDCLPLVQQCLRHLEELASSDWKAKENLKKQKFGETCMEVLRVASQHLANAAKAHTTEPAEKGTGDGHTAENITTDGSGADRNVPEMENGNSKAESSNKSKRKLKQRRKSSDDSDSSMEESSDDGDEKENEVGGKNENSESPKVGGDEKEENTVVAPGRYCAPLCVDLGAGRSSMSELSLQTRDWLREVAACVLKHPLVDRWLFQEGFRHGGTPKEWLVGQLCDFIQTLVKLFKSSTPVRVETDPVIDFDVTEKCSRLVQAALAMNKAGKRELPGKLLPLFSRCLETLLSIGGGTERVLGLLTLAALPVENFVGPSGLAQGALVEAFLRIADAVTLDTATLQAVFSQSEQAQDDGFERLFGLAATLQNSKLHSLLLGCVKNVPEVSRSCSTEAFSQLLKGLGGGGDDGLLPLVESLMTHSAECRAVCGKWLKKKRPSMVERPADFAPVMLAYLQLVLPLEGTGSDDLGVRAVTRAVRQELDSRPLNADDSVADSTFLHVVCHLVNFNAIGLEMVHKVQTSIVLLIQGQTNLTAAHVQLLAACLRQRALHAAGLDLDSGGDLDLKSGSDGDRWREFEKCAGQVLLAGLQFVTESGREDGDDQGNQREALHPCLLQLCRDVLAMKLRPKLKSSIMTFWSEFVNTCLKYHYTDAKYMSLLRRLVLRLFAKEIPVSKKTTPEKAEEESEDKSQKLQTSSVDVNDEGRADDEDDGSEEDDDEEEEEKEEEDDDSMEGSETPGSKSIPEPPSQQGDTELFTNITRAVKILGLTKPSDVARKCVPLFSEKRNPSDSFSDFSEAVGSWTGQGTLLSRRFFPWSDTDADQSEVVLASASMGAKLVDLCERCVGHTAFLPILQGKEGGVRGEVVHLLTSLVKLNTACCLSLPLNALIAAYGATLSLTDQNLLYLMLACDVHGNKKLQPGLWGEKVVQRLQLKRAVGKSLMLETSLQQVLEILDSDALFSSVLHFPLTRTMEFSQTETAVEASRMNSVEGSYDPRFLLPIFLHFLGPEQVVDVRNFIIHNALGFVLAALSSHDALTRHVAVGVLSHFHSHADAMRGWSSRPPLITFLQVVMNAMVTEAQKLPATTTIFLAKAAKLFMDPGDDMHVPVFSFLALKAPLDVGSVPEFFHFFNSPKLKERLWILQLLQEGLRETSDHRLFQRSQVYKLLMCHINSSLTDYLTRRESLKVLVKASSIATVAKDLVSRHSLVPWLQTFINISLADSQEMTGLVCQLLHNLCYTTQFHGHRLWWLWLSRMARQCLLLTPLLACSQMLLDSCSHLSAQSLKNLLDILQHPHIIPASSPIAPLPLVAMATWHIGRLADDSETKDVATKVASSLGFKLPTESDAKSHKKEELQEDDVVKKGEQLWRLRGCAGRVLSRCDLKRYLAAAEEDQDSVENQTFLDADVKSSLEDAFKALRTCLSQTHSRQGVQ